MLSILISTILSAQTYTISGKVTDSEGSPLPGVNVVIKGTTRGVVTDLNGKFSIESNAEKVSLVFSYIGYLTEEVEITPDRTNIEITLTEDFTRLEEVVVVGYCTTRELSVAGSVTSVSTRKKRIKKSHTSSYTPTSHSEVKPDNHTDVLSGLLTAGEVNDFSKWKLWQDISQNEFNQYSSRWKINPENRYSIQLKNLQNLPVIDAQIELLNSDGKKIWQAKTDNTGKAELWANAYIKNADSDKLTITATYKGKTYNPGVVKEFHKKVNVFEIEEEFVVPDEVDIAFVVDATGSMSDEINYLKAELNDIMLQVKDSLQKVNLNLGSVFYRDHGDEYVVKVSDLSDNLKTTVDFIQANNADGGGDAPEAVDEALNAAIHNMSWNENALSRILFLVLDAPPHEDEKVISRMNELTEQAAKKGIRIVPLTCSGIDKSTEFLMRSIALLTNGTYSFLTDDSGIGNPHIEPTTDEYEVELLNDLLVRLIYQYTYVPKLNESIPEIQQDTAYVEKKIASKSDSTATNDETVVSKQISWKYYPNPTTGKIYIESEAEINFIYLTDISGKILERHEVKSDTSMLDLSQYPVGIYFISYEYAPDKWQSGKVMLIR